MPKNSDIGFLNPYRLYVPWPSHEQFYKILNFPSLTFPVLAECVGGSPRFIDGQVTKFQSSEFEAFIKDTRILCLTCPSGLEALNAALNIKKARAINPEIKVVLGGHHPTFNWKKWLELGADVVVCGEGERTFPQVIDALRNGDDLASIDGIAFMADGEKRKTAERELLAHLDDSPIPRFELLNPQRYNFLVPKNRPALSIETGRGCSHGCSFCIVNSLWRRRHRLKSVPRVVEELGRIEKTGVRNIALIDDNFGARPERDLEIFRWFADRSGQYKWAAFTRADNVINNPELFSLSRRSGFSFTLIGFESPEEETLIDFNKNLKQVDLHRLRDEYIKVYRLLSDQGVLVGGFFIVGTPGHSLRKQQKSIQSFWPQVCDLPLCQFHRIKKGMSAFDRFVEGDPDELRYFYADLRFSSVGRRIRTNLFFLMSKVGLTILKQLLKKRSEKDRQLREVFLQTFSGPKTSLKALIDYLYLVLNKRKGANHYFRYLERKYLK